jgi:hypothetical protein
MKLFDLLIFEQSVNTFYFLENNFLQRVEHPLESIKHNGPNEKGKYSISVLTNQKDMSNDLYKLLSSSIPKAVVKVCSISFNIFILIIRVSH